MGMPKMHCVMMQVLWPSVTAYPDMQISVLLWAPLIVALFDHPSDVILRHTNFLSWDKLYHQPTSNPLHNETTVALFDHLLDVILKHTADFKATYIFTSVCWDVHGVIGTQKLVTEVHRTEKFCWHISQYSVLGLCRNPQSEIHGGQ